MRLLRLALPTCLALLAFPASAKTNSSALERLLPTRALLIGEQHDAPAHQQLQRAVIEWLAARGQLAAVALEMAEQGHGTGPLPRDADEAQVQTALGWNDRAWPWKNYGPVVMAAVRAGVLVTGANLPRDRMKAAMSNAALDAQLPARRLAAQRERIAQSHCGLLPPAQIAPMTRVQIARDMSMADTLAALAAKAGPQEVAVLITGNGHTHRALGVPRFLPADVPARVLSARTRPAADATPPQADPAQADALTADDLIWHTPPIAARDHCAELRARFAAKPAVSPSK